MNCPRRSSSSLGVLRLRLRDRDLDLEVLDVEECFLRPLDLETERLDGDLLTEWCFDRLLDRDLCFATFLVLCLD